MRISRVKRSFVIVLVPILILLLLASSVLAETAPWTCPECGRANNSNFCPACGTKRPAEKIVCPGCGETYDPAEGFAFCPECGTPLQGDAESPSVPAARAESAPAHEPVSLTAEECQSVYREAVIGTAQMLSRAVTYCAGQADGTSGDAKWFASLEQRFADVDFGKPQAAAILQLPQPAVRELCDSLACDATRIARALNQKINGQFNKRYTEAAEQAAFSRDTSLKLSAETESCIAMLLVYGNDIGFVMLNEKNIQGALFISDESVLQGFGDAYLAELFGTLGVKDACWTLYETPEAVSALRAAKAFQGISGGLSAFISSEKALLAALPRLYSCGLFTPASIASECANAYLGAHDDDPEDGLAAARFVSEAFDEAIKWLDPDGRKWHEKKSASKQAGWPEAPQLTLPEDPASLTENPLKPGDRIVALYRNEQDDMTKFYLRLDVESALPAERIPEHLEEADYYLLISTHWEEDGMRSGITVYNAFTQILLYDAKTLDPVFSVGSQEDGIEGFTMASGKTHYVGPRLYRIIAKVNDKLLR